MNLRPNGTGEWDVDTTTHFRCGGPKACNEDGEPPSYITNCGGVKCEPPDSGPGALRLIVTCEVGYTCEQRTDNAFFIHIRRNDGMNVVPKWVQSCLAPGNVSQSGHELGLLPCACTKRIYR
ncbi:MAG TPA: hypothetical protein VMZ50_05375 [Phycisphaerae bacterium]|nr:hypothetical protein [Phycisphaerae bacterium]